MLQDVPGYRGKISGKFLAKRTDTQPLEIDVHVPHPARFAETNTIENRIDRNTARITANNIIPDQPRDINDCKRTEHDGCGQTAWRKEENAKDQSRDENPNRERMGKCEQAEPQSGGNQPGSDFLAGVSCLHCADQDVHVRS